VGYIWGELRRAIALIASRNDQLVNLIWVTIRVAVISTAIAVVIGLPLGLALGLGRFRGRRALHILANASLALPPVVVGVTVFILLAPQSAFGSLRWGFTLKAVYAAQALLALPYIVALTPAAIQGLPPGLLAQARALGAGRLQLSRLVLREAKIGVLGAVIAAFGAAISEVGAVIIVGGNTEGYDQTLASALLAQFNYYGNVPYELAIGIVLLALILVLIGVLTLLQQSTGAIQLRFRTD
jgi:tungstate transport system permease protein